MGGGGHVIIRSVVKDQLNDPLVHGMLPTELRTPVDAVLAKDIADWTHVDCLVAGAAVTWALCNL
ncbi:MAG TPA: hypothetical protein VK626_01825 [Nitrospiraceae bacterium]|nr:hypothetical protein [Nitrospiraceae bacterium]